MKITVASLVLCCLVLGIKAESKTDEKNETETTTESIHNLASSEDKNRQLVPIIPYVCPRDYRFCPYIHNACYHVSVVCPVYGQVGQVLYPNQDIYLGQAIYQSQANYGYETYIIHPNGHQFQYQHANTRPVA